MNNTDNPYQANLNALLDKLNTLQGLVFHLEDQLGTFRKSLLRTLQDREPDTIYKFLGTRIVFTDLTEEYEDGFRRNYTAGHFSSQDEELLKVADLLLQRQAAWSIAQQFEVFETFLKDTLGTFFYLHPNRVDTNQLGRWQKKYFFVPNGVDDWREFVRFSYNKNIELFKALRKYVPALSEAEQNNNRGIDLTSWYQVVSVMRHATTHSDLVIHASKITHWNQNDLVNLDTFFSGEVIDGNYNLRPSYKQVEKNARMFAEYALLIFKYFSMLDNYYWRTFHDKHPKKLDSEGQS